MMQKEDQKVASLSELITLLAHDLPGNQPTWFRGQVNAAWDLVPSVARYGGVPAEMALVKRFMQNALPYIQTRPGTEWEWLFVMQHHGLPTRLLDWTESPLVGLYFSVTDDGDRWLEHDGALWAMQPLLLNQNSKWDTEFTPDIPAFDVDEDLEQYLPSALGRSKITLQPIAAIASRNNPRLQLQQGVFTIHHKNLDPLNVDSRSHCLWRYIIPVAAKNQIIRELRMLNLTKLSLFPDFSNVAQHARELLTDPMVLT